MKKRIFSILGVAAFAGAMAVNVNMSTKNNENDVALANVEALAIGEIPDGTNCKTNGIYTYCGYVEYAGVRFSVYWTYPHI